ncbi:hypothetical protein ABIF73_000842 [Bradyrhizobium japonicum]
MTALLAMTVYVSRETIPAAPADHEIRRVLWLA